MSAKRFMNWEHGFTLIELMVVVVVISILASIAIPSYIDSIRKSRRADAKTALVQLAQFMEQNYSLAQRYDQDSAGKTLDPVGGDGSKTQLPFYKSPVNTDSVSKYYDLSLSSVDQNTFTLQARPIAGSSQEKDVCETLSIDNAGAKKTSTTRKDCW